MPGRRPLVVTLADAAPGAATAWAVRVLAWAQDAGLRPVLVLGDLGDWRERLEGFGPIISADRPDDYPAARALLRTGAPRGLRPLRWLRARWWRLRLRRAGIVALSGPVPEIAARALPPRLRRRAASPADPGALPPRVAAAGPPISVAGVGLLDGDDGADLYLRLLAVLRARGVGGPFAWFGAHHEEDRRPFEHDRWHLGLDDQLDLRTELDADGTAIEALAADVVVVPARPGTSGLPEVEALLPGLRWVRAAGAPPVVGFTGVVEGAGTCATGTEVAYPDLHALADAVVAARAASADEHAFDELLAGAWAR